MKYNPQSLFVSQQGQALYPESGCGVASLLMLLKFINYSPLPNWEKLCGNLRLDVSPVEKGYAKENPEIGLYPEDIFRFAVKENLLFRVHFFDDEWQSCLEIAPIMVLLDGIIKEYPEEPHWVVLTSYDGKIFSYLDPWSKESDSKKIALADFKQFYTGIACQLLAKQKSL
ncbi:MAG: hypothetical protein JSR17_04215 [Proteobacteria bacterium]|nr:hypothetical protein [Pseudomonadota bacterium]